MAAANTDNFIKVGESTATTLSSPGYTIGATSINVASTTNWPTDTGVLFAIDEVDAAGVRVAGTYNVFAGVVSGATQISSLSYVGGDANRNYSAGATTRVYVHVGADRIDRLVDGILTEHNQDGTHGDITSTGATLTTPKVITSINDTNNNELVKVTATGSAVNEITITNAATGNAPVISATGDDTDIDLDLTPKGTGEVTKAGNPIDWWEEIGRTTLGSAGDTITVSFTAKKYLIILLSGLAAGGTLDTTYIFNSDSASNYAYTASGSMAAGATATSVNALPLELGATDSGGVLAGKIEVLVNLSGEEKLLVAKSLSTDAAGAGTVAATYELMGKWANTSAQLSSITWNNTGSGNFDVGSEVIVLGHN